MGFHPMLQTGPGGSYPRVRLLPVYGSGTAFVAGELVLWDGTHYGVDRCGTDPSAILGIAMCGSANATIYANSRIPVAVLTPDDVVIFDITNNTAAYNPNDQILFLTYGVTRDSGGHWRLDINKSNSNQVATVVGYSPARATPTGGAISFGQPFTHVKFLAAALQGDSIVS